MSSQMSCTMAGCVGLCGICQPTRLRVEGEEAESPKVSEIVLLRRENIRLTARLERHEKGLVCDFASYCALDAETNVLAQVSTLTESLKQMTSERDYHEADAALIRQEDDVHIAHLEAEIQRLKEIEFKYRKSLWLGHGHTHLYGDDGELQCTQCPPDAWDYRRLPLEVIERAAWNARVIEFEKMSTLNNTPKHMES